MKSKHLLVSLLFAVCLMLGATKVFAQGREVRPLPERFPQLQEQLQAEDKTLIAVPIPQIKVGENLVINEDVEGDLIAAGESVTINGKVGGDLIVAGKTVTINGEVANDLRAAGGVVFIAGSVQKNISVVGGQLIFSPESKIAGSVMAGGGEVTFAGEILGKVWVGGGQVTLTGIFGDDVEVGADEITTSDKTMIAGNFNAQLGENDRSDEEIISAQQIKGSRQIVHQTDHDKPVSTKTTWMQKLGKVAAWAVVGGIILRVVTGMLTGSFLLYFFPKLAKQLNQQIIDNPIASLGMGFAYLILAPIAAILLMILVVTLPLGVFILLFYIMDMMIARLVTARLIGQQLASQLNESWLKSPYVQLLAGLLIYQVLGMIPVLGWIGKLVGFFIGLGALAEFGLGMFKKQPVKISKKK